MPLVQVRWRPAISELRAFALVGAAVLAVGAVLALRASSISTAILLLAVAATLGFLAALAPRTVRPVYLAWLSLTLPVAWGLSYLLLAIAYFGVVALLALVMRLAGRDTLGRRFDRNATTYWQRRPPQRDAHDYFRQF